MPLPSSRTLRLALLALALVWGGFTVDRALQGSNDFDGFHAAAKVLWEQGRLVDDKAVARYPPTFQVLLLPFGVLPVGWAAACWYLLSLAVLLALPGELFRLTGVPPARQGLAWLAVAPLVLNDLSLGQSGLLLLWAATWAAACAREGQELRAGAVLGLCAAFKLLPVVLLALPLVLGRWPRALSGWLLGVTLVVSVAVVLLGAEATLEAFRAWLFSNTADQTPWGLVQQGRSMRFNNQSLATVLARTFGDIGRRKASGSVSLASLPLSTVWWIYAVVVTAIAALGLAAATACRRLVRSSAVARDDGATSEAAAAIAVVRAEDAAPTAEALALPSGQPMPPARRAWAGLFALCCLTLLFVAPLVWTHYFVWVLPALVVVPLSRRVRLAFAAAFVLALASEPLRGFGVHLWLSLVLFVVLAVDLCRRGLLTSRRRARTVDPGASSPC